MIVSVKIFQCGIYVQRLSACGGFEGCAHTLGQTYGDVFLPADMLEPSLGAYVLTDRVLAHKLR